ncbi:alanine/glycine:cation symporter family protein [Corynebacterium aquilae]|uniref:alanine/glycine:cation symporter family protein n=1 Tax=Corynebacterium aquilae TaxID=203263 RepID=UPI0009533820|nr:alanine/glycine:cation symporter family protein [Corynebacterium aquilae]
MDILVKISDGLWNPMAYFALLVGLIFTIVIGAAQFRLLPHTLTLIFRPSKDSDGIAPFQALFLTIASRVGVGNIAGVGTAVYAGGPGAMFWMFIVALLGAASSFAESALAQVYKRRIGGEHRGGMPFYVRHGLRIKWLAALLAIMTAVGYGILFPGVQSNNIAASMNTAFNINPWVTAVVVTGILGVVIFGGTRRIVWAADLMVPIMAALYILVAIAVLVVNYDQVIPTCQLIIASAFGKDAVFGGMAGAAVAWGVRRAVFSNVAGVGEGTYASAAASVQHPAQQGLVQSFSIFIDTCIVCFATGAMLIITESYNVKDADGNNIVEHLSGVDAGSAYTQNAVDSLLPGFGSQFVAIALFFFAFTTLIAFFYITYTNYVFLFGGKPNKVVDFAIKAGLLAMTFYGAVESADVIWTIGDIGYASLGWVNMICILLLIPVVRKVIVDYDRKRKSGEEMCFRPSELGIKGATFWESTCEAEQNRLDEIAYQPHVGAASGETGVHPVPSAEITFRHFVEPDPAHPKRKDD